MQAAGYQYINIDDMWQAFESRLAATSLPNSSKFPNGMKAVADYVHSPRSEAWPVLRSRHRPLARGLPGSYGHETQDARTYAAWGIDYLKIRQLQRRPWFERFRRTTRTWPMP